MSSWLNSVLQALHLDGVYTTLAEKYVPKHRSSVWYYFGGLVLFFFTIQIVSGVLLAFYYVPTPTEAHASIARIMTEAPFGWLIRSAHSWGANLTIALMLIHMFSVFFMKAYRHPRELMWLTGIVLLLLMLGFGFTGYLLPWDETAYFATQIGAEVPASLPLIGDFISTLMKGAHDTGPETLTRMFALHVGVFPLIAALVVLAHITMTSLFGVSVPPNEAVKGEEKYFSSFITKEIALWLTGFAVLIIVASLYPWELGRAYDLAKPTEPPANIHPEWYFMFLFQALKFVPEWMALVGFGLFMVFWTLVPFLDKRAGSKTFSVIGLAGLIGLISLTAIAYTDLGEAPPPVGVLRVSGDSDVIGAIWFFAAMTIFIAFVLLLYRQKRKNVLETT